MASSSNGDVTKWMTSDIGEVRVSIFHGTNVKKWARACDGELRVVHFHDTGVTTSTVGGHHGGLHVFVRDTNFMERTEGVTASSGSPS